VSVRRAMSGSRPPSAHGARPAAAALSSSGTRRSRST
jgi:hypothetical protein